MDKRTDKIIKNYISFAANQNKNFITAYLFGSYAKQTDNPDSDIDIALIIDKLDDNKKFDLQVELMLMASDFDLRIEPRVIQFAKSFC